MSTVHVQNAPHPSQIKIISDPPSESKYQAVDPRFSPNRNSSEPPPPKSQYITTPKF